jgi:hypothetical protein
MDKTVDCITVIPNCRLLTIREKIQEARQETVFLSKEIFCFIQHYFICGPSHSAMSADAGIEHSDRTVATGTLALRAVRRSNH